MKKLALLSLLIVFAFVVKAQEPMFVKGDKVVNVGIGFDEYTNLSISGEYGLVDGIADKGTIGAGIYAGLGYSILNPSWYSNQYHAVGGLRGTFHYPFLDKFDTYAGFGMGLEYSHWSYDFWGYDDYDNYTHVGLNAGFFLGARYALSEKLTVFGEAGYGIGYLTAGISFKL
jgi:hypothetical protein